MFPELGGVYTITDIFDASVYGHDEHGVLLEEVVNPVRRHICKNSRRVRVEQFWLAIRFRPLRTTNVDVFLRMSRCRCRRESASAGRLSCAMRDAPNSNLPPPHLLEASRFVRLSRDAVSKLDWAGDGAERLKAFAGAKDRQIAIVEHAPED